MSTTTSSDSMADLESCNDSENCCNASSEEEQGSDCCGELDTSHCYNFDASGNGGSSSHRGGAKRSVLVTEELQRREMIRFEDELHKIILIPRM